MTTMDVSNRVRRALVETVVKTPFLFGLAFCRAWVVISTWVTPAGEIDLPYLRINTFFNLSCALTALFLVLFLRKVVPLSSNRALLRPAWVAMTLAAVCLALGHWLPYQAFFLAFAILGGFGFTTLTLAWTEFYASLNPVRAVLFYSVSLIIGELLALVLTGYAVPHIFVVEAALPAASAACLAATVNRIGANEPKPPVRFPSTFPWKPVVLMAMYSFAFAVAQATADSAFDYPRRLLLLIPPCLVAAGILADMKRFSLLTVYKVLFPIMLCALLLPATVAWFPKTAVCASVKVSFFASGIFCMIVFGELSYRLRVSALSLFGIVKVFNYGGMFVGSVCRDALLDSNGSFSPTLSLLFALAIATAAVIMLSERQLFSNWDLNPNDAHANVSTQSGGPAGTEGARDKHDEGFGAVVRFSRTFHLTEREEEILHLLVQGKTVNSIANNLFLAQGTVKAHIQHIYQKVGVHSRSELLEVIGIPEPRQAIPEKANGK